jgi:hypothetical protein
MAYSGLLLGFSHYRIATVGVPSLTLVGSSVDVVPLTQHQPRYIKAGEMEAALAS